MKGPPMSGKSNGTTVQVLQPPAPAPAAAPLVKKPKGPPKITGLGYFTGVTDEEYFEYDALNASTIKAGLNGATMADVKHYLTAPDREASESQVLGTLLGIRLFDPVRYHRVTVPGPINPTTKEPFGATSVKYREFAAACEKDGKIPLGSGPEGPHSETIERMFAAVMAHPQASKLVNVPGDLEPVAVWDEPIFEGDGDNRRQVGTMRAKAKADKMIRLEGYAPRRIEVKTTKSLVPKSWCADISTFGYHTQDEWYDRGFGCVLGVKMAPAWMLVVQNCGKFGVCVDTIDPPSKRVARVLVDEFLVKFHAARSVDMWPGEGFNYVTGEYDVRQVGLPEWELARFAKHL